jgi:hypothetical protein
MNWAGFGCGVILRSNATRGYLFLAWKGVTPEFIVAYRIADWSDPYMTPTQLIGSWNAGVSWLNGNHLLKVAVVGTTFHVFVNDAEVGSLVDTVYTTGTPGVAIHGGAPAIAGQIAIEADDYRAGDAARTFTAVRTTEAPSRLMSFERDDEEVQLVTAAGGTIESEAGVAAW